MCDARLQSIAGNKNPTGVLPQGPTTLETHRKGNGKEGDLNGGADRDADCQIHLVLHRHKHGCERGSEVAQETTCVKHGLETAVVQGHQTNSNHPLRTGDVLAGIAGDGEHNETQDGRVDVERLAHGLDGPRQVPARGGDG